MIAAMPHGSRSSVEESQRFVFSVLGTELVFVLVIMTVSIIIEIFFMFAFPLVADRKMSGLDAVKLSFKASRANMGGLIGLMLLNALFGFVGVLCCIIGVYFYLPVMIASQAVAYRRVFPAIGQFVGAFDSIVMTGLVDTHVHVNDPGRTEWEGFETATRAAAAGGVTTIVDMPLNSIPATTTLGNFKTKLEAAREKLHVDVAFWGGVVPGNTAELAKIW